MRITLLSHAEESTREIGWAIGANAAPGDALLLCGGLGAGKTTLTQGVLWGLGSDEYARSPTFVLVNEYEARLPLYHMDLYRLESFDELDDLGLEEYFFGDGMCVVEWADKATGYFPTECVTARIETISDGARRLTLSADSHRYRAVFDSLARLNADMRGQA